LGLATQIYVADNNDFLPPEGKATPLATDLAKATAGLRLHCQLNNRLVLKKNS
jgi:hypothetical protein